MQPTVGQKISIKRAIDLHGTHTDFLILFLSKSSGMTVLYLMLYRVFYVQFEECARLCVACKMCVAHKKLMGSVILYKRLEYFRLGALDVNPLQSPRIYCPPFCLPFLVR